MYHKIFASKIMPVLLITVMVALAALNVQPVQAAGAVTSCNDTGTGTLRSAVSGGGLVTFSVDCTITLATSITISSTTATIIDGSGHKVTISGNSSVRPFVVNPGRSLTLKQLTITNGRATTTTNPDGNNGGAVDVDNGTLIVDSVTFIGNSAIGSGTNTPGWGGAIYNNNGTVTITNSTFSGNSVTGGTGTNLGGAIFNEDGNVSILNSTFSGNVASTGGGGAIHVQRTSTAGPSTSWQNSIITASTGSNCAFSRTTGSTNPTLTNNGGNVSFGDTTCPVGTNGSNANPNLAALGYYGARIQTFALQTGSSALGLPTTGCPTVDQRGAPRTNPTACDSGSFEFGALAPTTTDLTSTTANPTTYGATVNLTATVSPIPADGSVTFTEGTTNFGSAPVNTTTGVASITITVSALGAGDHTITAAYGSSTYSASSSDTLNRHVDQRAVTVAAYDAAKVYGDADPALTYHITSGSLVGTDAFSGALSRNAGTNVGSYPITQGSLTLGANYALTFTPGANLTITARPVTVTAYPQSKTYGEADPDLTYHITSGTLIGSDAFSGMLTRNAGTNVGTYPITQGSLTLGANYNLTFNGANLTITARPVTVDAYPQTKVYGDADPDLTYHITSGSLVGSDDFTGALTRAAGTGVGTYAIQRGNLALSANYTLTFNGANLVITTRPVAVTADPQTKVYGDADPTLTYDITSGSLVGSDDFTGALGREAGTDIGAYEINLGTLTLGANYALNLAPGATLTITVRPVTVEAYPQTKVYGDPDPLLTYHVISGSLVAGDDFTGALSRTPGTNVGAYPINQGTLALSANYDLGFNDADLTITARPVTVAAYDQTKEYGEADPDLTYHVTVGTLVTGDSFSGDLDRAAGENVGSHAIQRGTLTLGANYNMIFVEGNLAITARPVTVAAYPQTKVYGEADPDLTYHITAGTLVTGDDFTGTLGRAAGENVGNHAINQGSLTLGTNYNLTFTGDNLTITARPVTVDAYPQTKVYGDADPTFTYHITSGTLVTGDSFSGALGREAGANVGTYAINQGSLTLGTNYNLTFNGANLTITVRAVTVTADTLSKVYGDPDPALSYHVTSGSLATGDSFSGALVRIAGANVGSYPISQGTLGLSNNYDLTFNGSNLTITAAPLTLTADDKVKVFGQENPELTFTATGLKNGDTKDDLGGAPELSTTATTTSPAGEYTISISAGTVHNSNYTIQYADGTLTILGFRFYIPKIARP